MSTATVDYSQETGTVVKDSERKSQEEKSYSKSAKGVLMLANPRDNELNVYTDPRAKTGNAVYKTPMNVRVDESDTLNINGTIWVKITEIPDHPGAIPGYARKSSIRNTDAVFKAMELANVTTDVERNVYLANINHESGEGVFMAESTHYTSLSYWRTINRQVKQFCNECDNANLPLEQYFGKWTDEDKANYMYGVEAETLPNNQPTNLSSGNRMYYTLGNVNKNDGSRFRGRGSIQLTGRNNYTAMNKKLNTADSSGLTPYQKVTGKSGNVDIVANPELVSTDEYLANAVSALFWRDNVHDDVKGPASRGDKTGAIQESRNDVNSGCGTEPVTEKYNELGSRGYNLAYNAYKAEKAANPQTESPKQQQQQIVQIASLPENTKEAVMSNTNTANLTDAEIQSAITYNKKNNQDRCKEIQTIVGLTGKDVDGSFGPITVKAIAAWQAKNSLDPDGKFGKKSRECAEKLANQAKNDVQPEAKPETKPEAQPETKPEETKNDTVQLTQAEIESAIAYNKKNNQSSAKDIQRTVGLTGKDVDGDFGPTTVKAIAAWQAKNNLEPDGKFGKKSRECAEKLAGQDQTETKPEAKPETKPEETKKDEPIEPGNDIKLEGQVTSNQVMDKQVKFALGNPLTPTQVSDAIAFNDKEGGIRRFKLDWVGRLYSVFGISCPSNHYFTEPLVQAVASFQKHKNDTVDGKIGYNTRKALEAEYPVLFDELYGDHINKRTLIKKGTDTNTRYEYYKSIILAQGGAFNEEGRPNILCIRGATKQDDGSIVQAAVNKDSHFNSRVTGYDDLTVNLWVKNENGKLMPHVSEYLGSADPQGTGHNNNYGTAHLRDGQYEYYIGTHPVNSNQTIRNAGSSVKVSNGRYTALNPGSNLEIIRDFDTNSNNDRKITDSEFNKSVDEIYKRNSAMTNPNGINIHTSSYNSGTASTGCQNVAPTQYNKFMSELVGTSGKMFYMVIDASKINVTI